MKSVIDIQVRKGTTVDPQAVMLTIEIEIKMKMHLRTTSSRTSNCAVLHPWISYLISPKYFSNVHSP